MGIHDTDNHPVVDVDDDEHLYSRRASAHTLYSTTASSGRSSPVSRRGSLNTVGSSAARPRTYTLSRNDVDDGYDAYPYRLPHVRAMHPASLPAGPPLNYDGIIKHPSRYPYARSHHHHPYAHYAHDHHQHDGPPPPGHPYYTQKRHSFAALRTTPSRSSLSSSNMAAMTASSMPGGGEPPLPQVRLPSIDQGLPPFPGDTSGMILPMRRGSLTDPLLHAHNPSSSSSNALAGPSGTSSFSHPTNGGLSPYKTGTFPYSASYDPSVRRVNEEDQASNNAYNYPSPVSVNTPSASASTAAKDAVPFFKKTSKTLFPQQHGSSLSPAPVEAPLNSTSSGTASVIGTKRKLDPLSESEFGAGAGDYFTPEAPSVGNTVRPSPTAPQQENVPATSGPKRRASQAFINAVNEDSQNQLPTPAATVSITSAGSTSATSSERRTSNESSEPFRAGPASTSAHRASPTQQPSVQVQEETSRQFDARYSKVTPRQLDHTSLPPQDIDAELKAGYAFPLSRNTEAGDPSLSPTAAVVSSNQASSYSTYYDPQHPHSPRAYPIPASSASTSTTLQHIPPYAPPAGTEAHRILPPGAALPPDSRSRASAIFGGTSGGRPSYASTGEPVGMHGKLNTVKMSSHGQQYHAGMTGVSPGGMVPMYNGPKASTKGGFAGGPSALSGQQQQHVTDSSLPYARSPALKVSHKIAERKRRKEMKELFDELRDCIPSMNGNNTPGATVTTTTIIDGVPVSVPTSNSAPHPPDVGGRGIKSSKWEVLAKAVEYITKLQYENSELNNSVLELQRLNQAFQDELTLVKNGGTSSATMGGNNNGPMQYQQDQQLYPHQQGLPQGNSGSYGNHHQSSAHPSPVSVHSMPPLTHHSHSMPAAIGGGTHSSLHSPHPSLHHSPLGSNAHTPATYPISAPPHMASHSFFGPNDTVNGSGNTAQAFANPNQRHFAMHSHSRNVSMGSNNGSVNGGQGQFEHAGSAPPALQQHPHQQHPNHLQQQHQLGGTSSHHGSPLVNSQSVAPTFTYQGSPAYEVQGQSEYTGHPQQQQQMQRPSSLRSHHSNQSVPSGQSQPSHSPVPQSLQVQQHQQQHDATWGSSSPYSQQVALTRNGTVPPGSAQGTAMMSPLNPTY